MLFASLIAPVVQIRKIAESPLFLGFWLTAQQEYRGIYRPQQVKLSLFFSDCHSTWVKVNSTDATDVVMNKIATALGLSNKHLSYFGLFVIEINRLNSPESNGCNGKSGTANGRSNTVDQSDSSPVNDGAGDRAGDFNGSKSIALHDDTASLLTSPNRIKLLRKLQNFEAPFLTLETMESHMMNVSYTGHEGASNIYTKRLSLTLRKCYWDCHLDSELLKNDICLHLLYHQTVSDLQQGWIPMTKEVKYQLDHYIKAKSKSNFLDLAKTLKYYSYMHFDSSYSDYLSVICDINQSTGCNASTVELFESSVMNDMSKLKSSLDEYKARVNSNRIPVIVSLGGKELLIRPAFTSTNGNDVISRSPVDGAGPFYLPSSGQVKNEVSFKLTRIRCWRLTATEVESNSNLISMQCNPSQTSKASFSNAAASNNYQLSAPSLRRFKFELSFEYLINRSLIKSITIESNEAVLMSMCLQGMVNELLSKRNKFSSTSSPVSPVISSACCTNTFLRMDGSKQIISSSIYTPNLSASQSTLGASNSSASFNSSSESSSCPSLCDPASACNDPVNSTPGKLSRALENEAFEGFKDEIV